MFIRDSQNIGTVLALIGNVMDGEHGLDAVELVQMTIVQDVYKRQQPRGSRIYTNLL